MLSKSSLGVAAGAAAIGFIGYCIYFDHKRRSDPLFKQKLRERRRKEKESQKKGGASKIPNLSDPDKMQQFFVQEIQLGEELISRGDITGGVEHLATAAVVSGEPQQLLALFSRNLPPQVFQLLTQQLPVVSARIASSMQAQSPAGPTLDMMEEDLE